MSDEPDEATRLRDLVIGEARRLGFHRVGIVPVEPPRRHQAYLDWIDRGHAAGMTYLASPDHIEGRRDTAHLLSGARTVVVVALAYSRLPSPAPQQAGPAGADAPDVPRGFIARYARGADYHMVLKEKLAALAAAIAAGAGRPVAARPCSDTAPLLERELAERAAIGFVAKNTMLIAPGLGSYVLLGELLLDIDIATTTPRPTLAMAPASGAAPSAAAAPASRCGRCRACLDVCPTQAFTDAYVLDARRCISYLTIENTGEIPRPLRAAVGTMIFGCDLCQEVCPFNAGAERTPPAPELAPLSDDRNAPDLLALLDRNTNQLRQFVKRSALRRIGREQLIRNVCVALGNAGDPRALPGLERRLRDRSPLIRSHAAWALGRLAVVTPAAATAAAGALRAAVADETDSLVRGELAAALADADASAAAAATAARA